MKQCSKCREIKVLSEFGPWNTGGKCRLQSFCKLCSKVYYAENKDKSKSRHRAYVQANRDAVKAYHSVYYLKNKERLNAAQKITNAIWTKNNKERILNKHREWERNNREKAKALRAAWQKRYPERVRAFRMKYLAAKRKAIPLWANHFFIEEIYDLAVRRTKITGIHWEVDHIVPMQSDIVCGFHTEQNLRVVPRSENRMKSNSHWPDMP